MEDKFQYNIFNYSIWGMFHSEEEALCFAYKYFPTYKGKVVDMDYKGWWFVKVSDYKYGE